MTNSLKKKKPLIRINGLKVARLFKDNPWYFYSRNSCLTRISLIIPSRPQPHKHLFLCYPKDYGFILCKILSKCKHYFQNVRSGHIQGKKPELRGHRETATHPSCLIAGLLLEHRAMMFRTKRHFLHILIAVALVLSTASPACQFISGQAKVMEICSGTELKQIPLPDGYETPQIPAKENSQKKNNSCNFCFTQAHFGKIFAPPSIIQTAMEQPSALLVMWNQRIPARHELRPLSARAPPVLI